MRVLVDESLPRSLIRHLAGVTAETVFDRGWAGLTNGRLLAVAAAEFDVFLTADQNLQYQQNLRSHDIGVVVVAAVTNRLADLQPLLPAVVEACRIVQRGEVRLVRVTPPGGAA